MYKLVLCTILNAEKQNKLYYMNTKINKQKAIFKPALRRFMKGGVSYRTMRD